ncbi:MAG: DnaJ domain-containing protein [Firmicutes bacterium]|nr:DnaJ domain-containing protein [Bacillota bacterium]
MPYYKLSDSDHLKHKVRKLKTFEKIINGNSLVWDSFFDLRGTADSNAKYSLPTLTKMTKEEYNRVIDEFFAKIYYAFYKDNNITGVEFYDPAILKNLGLPPTAARAEIKKKFRELAKKHHPDAGGSSEIFIELMENYEKLYRQEQ